MIRYNIRCIKALRPAGGSFEDCGTFLWNMSYGRYEGVPIRPRTVPASDSLRKAVEYSRATFVSRTYRITLRGSTRHTDE